MSGVADKRYDWHGEMRLVAFADGHVMYRRPGCQVCVCSAKDWDLKARMPFPSVETQSSIRPDDEA